MLAVLTSTAPILQFVNKISPSLHAYLLLFCVFVCLDHKVETKVLKVGPDLKTSFLGELVLKSNLLSFITVDFKRGRSERIFQPNV